MRRPTGVAGRALPLEIAALALMTTIAACAHKLDLRDSEAQEWSEERQAKEEQGGQLGQYRVHPSAVPRPRSGTTQSDELEKWRVQYVHICNTGLVAAQRMLPRHPAHDRLLERGYSVCVEMSRDLLHEAVTSERPFHVICGHAVGAMFATYGLREEVTDSVSPRALQAAEACLQDLRNQGYSIAASPSGQVPSASMPDTPSSQPTIADAAEACKAIQDNANIPIGCITDYISNVPSMVVYFRTHEEHERFMGAIAKRVGVPFCGAANRANRRASFYVAVGGRAGVRFDCEFRRWGKWFELGSKADPTPPTLAETVRLCSKLQADQRVLVTCETDYIDSVPSMLLGFRNAKEAEALLPSVAEKVGDPFCAAANSANRRANVFMVVGNQAMMYSCELGRWGEWFELETDKRPNVQYL